MGRYRHCCYCRAPRCWRSGPSRRLCRRRDAINTLCARVIRSHAVSVRRIRFTVGGGDGGWHPGAYIELFINAGGGRERWVVGRPTACRVHCQRAAGAVGRCESARAARGQCARRRGAFQLGKGSARYDLRVRRGAAGTKTKNRVANQGNTMNQNPSTQLGAALSGEGRTDVGHGADAGIRGAVMPGFVSRPDAGSAASLRVLHVYKTYLPDSWGGLENAIFQICSSTGKLGIEHRIISLSRGDTRAISVRPEVEVHRYPVTVELASCPFSLAALQDFKSQIGWADVVHYHFPWPFADILDFQRAADRLPAIVTYHSDIVRQRLLLHLYRPLMYRLLTRSYCIIATSPNYLATSAELQEFRDKLSVIPLGLDEQSYPRPDGNRVDKWRARLGADFFLFIGVLRYYKGLHILIEAAQRTAATIVIVGSGPI